MDNSGFYAQLACIWEATARKPGNVHPNRSFADLQYIDFLHSAAAIAPAMDRAEELSVGEIVLEATQATRAVVNSNTNLGIVLLLAPLAKVPSDESIASGIRSVLNATTVEDARLVQRAIQLAQPGGMGERTEHDVSDVPTLTLREWMGIARERDAVALQYADNFSTVLDFGVPNLTKQLQSAASLEEAIIAMHLALLAEFGDTLIARKCGADVAREAQQMATEIEKADWPHTDHSLGLMQQFDDWLRANGNRRNPGTTADLVTACLFVALCEDIITLPLDRPFSILD